MDFESQQRADIVANRDALPMLDHIFQAWHYNHDYLGARASRQAIDLPGLYPQLSVKELAEIVKQVNSLWSEAYHYGDLAYLGEPHEQLFQRMREHHPGFSDPTYQAVLRRGYFEAR